MIVNNDKAREMRLAELEAQREEENKKYKDERNDREKENAEEKEAKEKYKNKNFVMNYRDSMAAHRWLMKTNGNAAAQLSLIVEHMDNRNCLMVSNVALAELLEVSETTVKRSTKILKDNGFIDILKVGNSNVYVVNPDFAWNSYENEKKYAKFNGTILLSQSENKNYEKGKQQERFKKLNAKISGGK